MHRPLDTARRAALAALLVACVAAGAAYAQDPAVVTTAEHEEYGTYLTDGDGMSLYLFVDEEAEGDDAATVTEGVRPNAAPCAGGCLEAWPPLTADAVEAGEGVDPDLLYLADVGGTMQVVYDGWPLYYFANDAEPGDATGQARGSGNVWYLLDAEGTPIRSGGGM